MIDKAYVDKLVTRYNKVENLGENWDFVKAALEEHQGQIILEWLNRKMDSEVALGKIEGIQWLLNFIAKCLSQGKGALEGPRQGE